MLAKHLCLKCGYKWEEVHRPTQCPKCDHLYVKWLNYEEMRKHPLSGTGWGKERKGKPK